MTSRLVITENITLDGVVENDGTWFDPTDDSEQGRELAEITRQHAAASDGFLVGRTTFEEMREFWPRQVDDTTGVTDHLNRVEKYVASRDLEDPGWDGTTVLRGGDGLAPAVRLPRGPRYRPPPVPGEHRAARSLPGREPGVLRRSRPAAVRTVGRRLPRQNRTMATDSIDQVTVAYGARADDYIHAVGRSNTPRLPTSSWSATGRWSAPVHCWTSGAVPDSGPTGCAVRERRSPASTRYPSSSSGPVRPIPTRTTAAGGQTASVRMQTHSAACSRGSR